MTHAGDPGAAAGVSAGPGERVLLRGGLVFDGTGSPPAQADVVVEDGRIADVGLGLDGDVAVDVTGCTVLPGFFDCHVHVTSSGVDIMERLARPFSDQFYEAARNLEATLATGVTTVRDAGGADLGIKRGSPRTRPPAGRGGRAAGADVIKICTTGGVLSPGDDPEHTQFSPAEIEMVVAEAGAAGRPVMAHAQGAAGVKNAVRAGARSIEHGIFLDEEAVDLMLSNQTWLVPTLVAPRAVLTAADKGARLPEAVVEKAREVVDVHMASVHAAVAADVPIAMGTDGGVGPHGCNLDEMPLLRDCGMSAGQVLVSATSGAARLCGLHDVTGRVAPGLLADLAVLAGDAYELGGMRERIRQVWRDGRLLVARQ